MTLCNVLEDKPFGLKALTSVRQNLSCGFGILFLLYELSWLLTTRHLTANIFSCIPIFLDNDFCKTINLFIIDTYACSVYLERKAPAANGQTSINNDHHVNMQFCLLTFCSPRPSELTGGSSPQPRAGCCQGSVPARNSVTHRHVRA